MAEQTFRSPGFFEREIDLTQRTTEIVGTPAGVIGTSIKGGIFSSSTLFCKGNISLKDLTSVLFAHPLCPINIVPPKKGSIAL